MIEVVPGAVGGWQWRLIAADGRTLMYGFNDESLLEAWADAYMARYLCWRRASQVDWRMGACF